MLNARKLVYLLPDVCYVAELLPAKKPHTFAVQSFRQINAQFMDDEELLIENVLKLFHKLEPDTYTLVLPDFLFTNTIIDVAETSESGVRKYLVDSLLPSLELSKETHQLETFILTQHKGKTKVQLSALEKSLLAPIFPLAAERQLTIEAICPVSWTLKSLISLEPSLSAVELGGYIYIAQHYIGVEQSSFFASDDLSSISQMVKTLRGAEPNLQTLYLLTQPELRDQLKEKLIQKIPVQQLSEDIQVEGLPTHLKTAIEAAAKTLDIEDFPVPRFTLAEAPAASSAPISANQPAASDEQLDELPTPTLPPASQPGIAILAESLAEDEKDQDPTFAAAPALPTTASPITITKTTVEIAELDPRDFNLAPADDELRRRDDNDEENRAVTTDPEFDTELTPDHPTQFVDRQDTSSSHEEADRDDRPLRRDQSDEEMFAEDDPVVSSARTAPVQAADAPRQRPVLRNRNSTGSMMKMIGISLAALVITVLVGVGAGFALLQTSERNSALNQALTPTPRPSAAPVVVASPSPAPSPTATAGAAVATIKTQRILVVNATGITGRAGRVKSSLTAAGYRNVDTGNATGKYEKGNFVLTAKSEPQAITQLQTDTKLTLTAGTQAKTTEDAAGKYDIVLVINE